jgi:exportin-2 (importin alpha re-exporter)
LQSVIQIFELPPDDSNIEGDMFIEIEDTPGYQAAYSQLAFAQPKKIDPLAEVPDARRYLIEMLGKLSQTRPGEVQTLIQSMPNDHRQALEKYSAQAGVRLA